MVNCCGVPAPFMSTPTDVWFIHLGVITYYTNRIILFWYWYYLDPLSAHVILWNYSVLLTIQTVPHYSIGCKYGPNRLRNTWMTQCKNRIPEYLLTRPKFWKCKNLKNLCCKQNLVRICGEQWCLQDVRIKFIIFWIRTRIM